MAQPGREHEGPGVSGCPGPSPMRTAELSSRAVRWFRAVVRNRPVVVFWGGVVMVGLIS